MQLVLWGAADGAFVFFIGHDVLEGPFHAVFEGVFAYSAGSLHTDAAGEVETAVDVDEEFHGLPEFLADQGGEDVELRMGLVDGEIPGNGEVTVYVQETAVFDDTEVVHVHPVLATAGVDIGDQPLEEFYIGLVHDAGDGLAQDAVARPGDDDGEEDGDGAVQPGELCIKDNDEAEDDACRRIGVGLQVTTAGLEGHGAVLFSPVDHKRSHDVVYDGGESHDINALVQLLDGMRVDEVYDGLIGDDEPGHDDEGAFYGGGKKFGLAMTIRVIFIPGFGGDVQTIKPDKAGDDVDGAFQRVGEDGDGLGEIISEELQ